MLPLHGLNCIREVKQLEMSVYEVLCDGSVVDVTNEYEEQEWSDEYMGCSEYKNYMETWN